MAEERGRGIEETRAKLGGYYTAGIAAYIILGFGAMTEFEYGTTHVEEALAIAGILGGPLLITPVRHRVGTFFGSILLGIVRIIDAVPRRILRQSSSREG